MDKIKTILAGIEGLIDRLPDESSFYSVGQRRAYELVKNIIYQQFPELQESEDERIRKWIVNLLHELRYDPTAQPMALKAIEYLEKQKKQPMELLEPDKNVEKIIEDIIRVYGKTQGEWVGGYDIDTLIVNLRRAFEQEEQKPALRLVGDGLISDPNSHFELVGEQKPVECIEFDNEFKNQVSHLLASVLNREWEYNKEFVEYTAQQLLGYAKHEISPAEWSEEDEKILKRVLETYTCYEADIRSKDILSDNDIEVLHECAEEKIWLKGRFKSLRPSWKPSEEQMGALKYELGEGGRFDKAALASLYNQLKKL